MEIRNSIVGKKKDGKAIPGTALRKMNSQNGGSFWY
jgi:hypothetical protein